MDIISEAVKSARQIRQRVSSYAYKTDNESKPYLLKEWFRMILKESERLYRECVHPVLECVKEIEWAIAQILPIHHMNKPDDLIQLQIDAQDAMKLFEDMKWDRSNDHNNMPWVDAFFNMHQTLSQAAREEYLFFSAFAQQQKAKADDGWQVIFWETLLQVKMCIMVIACAGDLVASDIHCTFMDHIAV